MIKKIWYVLSAKQRRRALGVAILTFIGSLFEVLGVSSIIPFINAILTPDVLMQKESMKVVCAFFHISDARSMIILLAVMIVVLYWIKNIYMIFLNSVQYRFGYNNRRRLSSRLLQTYVNQPYLYHVAHNSAELIRNVNTDVNMFFITILQLIHLQTNGGMCLLLLCVLLYRDKTITLAVIMCMAVFIFSFNKILKNRVKKKGEQNREISKELQKNLIQTFQGIKEIKVTGKEKFYFSNYDHLFREMVKLNHDLQIYTILPKPLLEIICITGLMGVIVLKVYRGVDLAHFVPTLALFALAAFRILPAAASITSSINTLVANQKAVNVIYDILKQTKECPEEKSQPIDFQKEIELRNVTFRYPETEKNVLSHVNLKILKNQATGFMGMSGGGKTTLIDIILGLLSPTEGKVCVDGVDICGHKRNWQDKIGYIPQEIYLSDDSIKKNVAFGIPEEEIDESKVLKVLQDAQLLEFISELDRGVETEIGEGGVRLSGGQRQRIGIARALYHEPEILVLDEATSALDTETEREIMETINALNGEKTLIIIAHRLSTIKKCDAIYRVANGTLEKTMIND